MFATVVCVGAMLTAIAAPGAEDSTGEDATPASAPLAIEPPPGADAFDDALRRRLAEGLAARGAEYRPRTRHLREGGSPRFTNRLILESSPYLLQHAHNPVNWHPWSDEAFEQARRSGRPVLLSIGYSTCHWCHVMEEESFEDLEIAEYLNRHYVAIKVDREERPDVDAIYMSAVQMLVGRGGWPMTTWLTPDREPFYGGTYFPARDGDRGSRTGFLTLLKQLRSYYELNPEQIAERAAEITRKVRSSMSQPTGSDSAPTVAVVDRAIETYGASFDETWGGIGRAPKFPSSLPVRLLLRHHLRTGDSRTLEMAERTLRRMAEGGMYDQIGGGFHRYSTDARWLVPHFEKMLYDNALLAIAYAEAYQLTGLEFYAEIAREIVDYLKREMTAPAGGFYSATDADSPTPDGHREEGWFFTWTPTEIRAILGANDAELVIRRFGVTEKGNFEGRSILHVVRPIEDVARALEIEPAAARRRLAAAEAALYRERSKRPPPLRDEKILTAWNGLTISAFARVGFALGDGDAIRRAAKAADFMLGALVTDGRLMRSFKDGRARHLAYLDDHAFLIAGLLDLFEAAQDVRYLAAAIDLQSDLDRYHAAPEGGYFTTATDGETLLAREKPFYDGAEPSGNSVALMNLGRLHELTGDDRYRVKADGLLGAFGGAIARRPTAASEMLVALEFVRSTPKEILIATDGSPSDARPFLDALRAQLFPHKVLVVTTGGESNERLARLSPWVSGKVARGGRATAYVCERGVCQLPTTDVERFRELLNGAVASNGPDDSPS